MQQKQPAPPVPPRLRRQPPPLNSSQSVDTYMQNNTAPINQGTPYNGGSVVYNNQGSVVYQNQGNYNNRIPNQRMSYISQQPINNYSQQQMNGYSPSHSPSHVGLRAVASSSSIHTSQSFPNPARGPPPKINYNGSGNNQYYGNQISPLNNPSQIQQYYGPPQGQRLQANNNYEQRTSPEVYVSPGHGLPNPPRKYVPNSQTQGGQVNGPPLPRRQVIPPQGNTHKVMPIQVSPSRSNNSSPSLSPMLTVTNSPKPPVRHSVHISSDNGYSPSYRYSHSPSLSPSLSEVVLPVPARQYQRGRGPSVSSQKLGVNGMGSPNSVASSVRYDNSPYLQEEVGLYKQNHHQRSNSLTSSIITVPNMDDDSYYREQQNNLVINGYNGNNNPNTNNPSSRYSMVSQGSGVSQYGYVTKTFYIPNIKENHSFDYSSDEDIEEAKVKTENRIFIEAEEMKKDGDNMVLDEKTLDASTAKIYKNLDSKEIKEIQMLSSDFDVKNSLENKDFGLATIINNDIEKGDSKKSNVVMENKPMLPELDLDISAIKVDDVDPNVDDINELSEKLDHTNKALLNVLTDEIKDLFKQVDENDNKENGGQVSDPSIERVKSEYTNSISSSDSLRVEDVYTHMNNSQNDDSFINDDRSSIYKHNSYHSNISYDSTYQYEERPSISSRNSVYSNDDDYNGGDDRSFNTYVSSASMDNRSIRNENYPSPSPSLDPNMAANPPKRPLRYYEMNNNQRNEVNQGAPSVPPRRHYRESISVPKPLPKPLRRQSLEICKANPPTPPRTSVSQPSNRKNVTFSPNNIVFKNGITSTSSNNMINNEMGKVESPSKPNTVASSIDEKEEKIFDDDFVYHTGDIKQKFPLVYHSANMSEIAANFRKRIKLVKHIKDFIEYMQSFSGYDAVTALADILGTDDRKVAQTVGQALEEQGMFHDVVYLHKLLDSVNHYYQFEDLAKPIAILERKKTESLSPENRTSLLRKLSERRSGNNGEFEESNPCGVLTEIAKCYSPTCTDGSPCYSYSCPRRRIMVKVTSEDTANRFSNMNMTLGSQNTWSSSLGKSYINKMTHQQIKRQEIIFEFIRTEKEYVNDLQAVVKYMINPLRKGKVIGIDGRFVNSVFGNIEEIAEVNGNFYDNLRKLQKRKPVLESLGDVVNNYVSNFVCYTKYGKNQPLAKQILQVQKNNNHHLNEFLKECQSMPQFRRLPIESFLARPTTRLGRYPILIRDILKNTSKNHRDQILLNEANTTIEEILKEVNYLAGRETNRLKMEQWYELLRFEKKNDLSTVHFDDPKREYIREGKLSLIVYNYVNEPVIEVTLLLLDNVLIITYEKNNNCHIYNKPIPISLMTLSYTDQKRYLKPSDSHSVTKRLVLNSHKNNSNSNNMGYSFTIKHLNVGNYTFFTPILSEQKAWIEAIQKQQETLPKPIAEESIFFSHRVLETPIHTYHRVGDTGIVFLANELGLYVLLNNTVMKPVLQCSRITQIESMVEYDTLFILSNHETIPLSINLLLKEKYLTTNCFKHVKKISSNVSFISTGYCDDKSILCCAKASANKTIVKLFEPKFNLKRYPRQEQREKLFLTEDIVTIYKQFYIPSEGVNIRFLRRSICVACTKSFEVVNIRNLTTQSLLNPDDIVFKSLLKSEYSPMNMFKTGRNDFLLCYNKIGFFIDKNGNRSRPDIFFKWNTTPKKFAYICPYIFVITAECISIWHETDPITQRQVISGNSLRFLYCNEKDTIIYSKVEDRKQRLAKLLFKDSRMF